MRILVFSNFYYPEKLSSGYIKNVHHLSTMLADRGHSVLVLCCGRTKQLKKERVDDVVVWRTPAWSWGFLNNSFPIPNPRSIFRAWKELKKEPVDIVSTQTRLFPISWIGFMFAKFNYLPLVHTERGSRLIATDCWWLAMVGWLIDNTLGRLIFSKAEAVVGVSEAVCDFALKMGAKNPVKIKNGVVMNFWDLRDNRPNRENFVLTYVGRLIYAKGIQDLLQAVALLDKKANFPPLFLNIVGGGVYKEKLQELAKNLKIEARVRFLGELDDSKIKKVFNETDVFVNPSYSEGFPTSVLEAGVAGLPVVATDVGGTREIIVSSEHGFLIKPRAVTELCVAIKALADDHDLGLKMGGKIKDHISQSFTWSRVVDSYSQLFTNVSKKCIY